jgi:hypothetical protein
MLVARTRRCNLTRKVQLALYDFGSYVIGNEILCYSDNFVCALNTSRIAQTPLHEFLTPYANVGR